MIIRSYMQYIYFPMVILCIISFETRSTDAQVVSGKVALIDARAVLWTDPSDDRNIARCDVLIRNIAGHEIKIPASAGSYSEEYRVGKEMHIIAYECGKLRYPDSFISLAPEMVQVYTFQLRGLREGAKKSANLELNFSMDIYAQEKKMWRGIKCIIPINVRRVRTEVFKDDQIERNVPVQENLTTDEKESGFPQNSGKGKGSGKGDGERKRGRY